MISRTSIFRKSIKGAEAIATRQPGMPPRLRSALIMVDGKRNVEELAKLVSMLGEPDALLTELEASGLIELAEGVAVASVPKALASTVAKSMAPPSSGPAPLTLCLMRS